MASLIYLNAILLAVRTIGQCLTSTIVVTYTDSYPSLQLSGPDNGDCQSTLSGVASFEVTSLDAGCAGIHVAVHNHPRSYTELTCRS
jgi:hypothetical protein